MTDAAFENDLAHLANTLAPVALNSLEQVSIAT